MGYKTQLKIFKNVEDDKNLVELNKYLDEVNVLSFYTETHEGNVMAFVIYTNQELQQNHFGTMGAMPVIEAREVQVEESN